MKKRMKKTIPKNSSNKSRSQNYIYKNFITSLKELKLIQYYFWVSLIIFLGTGIIGLAFPIFFNEKIIELIKNLIMQTEGLTAFELIRFIAANNIQSAFLGLALGIFIGIFPLGIIIVNGYILGFVANKSIAIEGLSVLWKLIPHGIFEIPAILISVGAGLWIGSFFFTKKNLPKRLGYFILSFVLFTIFTFIYLIIISLFLVVSNPALLKDTAMFSDQITQIISNPLLSFIFLIILLFCFFIGSFILDKKDKKDLVDRIASSLRIFIFIAVPLLIIAAIIEGLLIWMSEIYVYGLTPALVFSMIIFSLCLFFLLLFYYIKNSR